MRLIYVLLILLALAVCHLFAVNYPIWMIIDTERHLLKLTSAGSFTVTLDGSGTATTPVQGYPTVSIIDSDGQILKIANGAITIKGE